MNKLVSLNLMRLIVSFSTMLFPYSSLAAEIKPIVKDYGIRGHVFPIIEESLLEVIKTKLLTAKQHGLLEKLQQKFIEKVKRRIAKPLAVSGLHKATKNRSWTYDPSITQIEPITDHQGKIIVAAGTKVNPLDSISWGKPLIFVDGDEELQIEWTKSQQGIVVLTNGSPIDLTKQLGQDIYFDQAGILLQKFKIEAVPAIIEQDGKKLRIREIAL